MKKLMVIFLMLMVVMIASGEVLETEFAVELGIAPSYVSINIIENELSFYRTIDAGYVLFEFESVILKHVFLGGGVKTWITGTNNWNNFSPFQSDYLFNGGLRFGMFDMGWRHMCLHPTRPYEWNYDISAMVDGWYDEFYVRVEHKF